MSSQPFDDLPHLSAGEAAANLELMLTQASNETTRRRLQALLTAARAFEPDTDTLDYLAVRTTTVGDGPSASDTFRTFRSEFKKASARLGIPMTLDVDGHKKGGAEGRRCWFTGTSQRGRMVSKISANLTKGVADNLFVETDALTQDASDETSRAAEKELTVWVHLEHHPDITNIAEQIEQLLRPRLATHDQLGKLSISVRLSNCHLLAGQSNEQLDDRRLQATIIAPLMTHQWLADHQQPPWPIETDLVPLCAEPMGTRVKNGMVQLGSAPPVRVFKDGSRWPKRAGSNEAFVDELVDDLVDRIIAAHKHHQLRNMARSVALEDDTTVDHDAITIGLTEAGRSLQDKPTGQRDRTEAFHIVDHLEAWASDPEGKPYAVLLGDSGSGKTTAAQVLNNRLNAAYLLAQERGANTQGTARLSIYLDLRKADLDERQSPELERLINNVMEHTWEEEAARTISADVILDQVRDHGAVLIFDGLDEVLVRINEQRGKEFVQQLWRALTPAMVSDPNRNTGRLVMTCRTHYFPTIDNERSFFGGQDRTDGVPAMYEALHLLPFTEAQIRDYLAQHLGRKNAHQEGHAEVDAAMAMLADVHNLLELAERPYNLRLIAEQLGDLERLRDNGATVSLATLYDGFVRDWLSRDDTKHVLRPDDKRTLMEDLAGKLWRSSTRSMAHKDLSNWLMARLTEGTDLGRWFLVERPKFELTLEDLRTATFVVRPGADRFEFAHTSLLEFFLASYLVRALIDGRPDDWAIRMPSPETLLFVRDLLAELANDPDRAAEAEAAKAALRELGDTYRSEASELAFRYCAKAQGSDAITRPLAGFDLTGASLRHLELSGDFHQPLLNLSGSRLAGADLRDARLHRVRLDDADLSDARLDRAELIECSLSRTGLVRADLSAAILRDSRLANVSLAAATTQLTKVLRCQISDETFGVSHAFGDVLAALNVGGGPIGLDDAGVESASRVEPFMEGPADWTLAVSFSPNGSLLAVAKRNGAVLICDSVTGEVLRVLFGDERAAIGLAYSPDNIHVAVASYSGTTYILDTRSAAVVHTLKDPARRCAAIAYSPDGARIAIGNHDGTVGLWDSETGSIFSTFQGDSESIRAVAYSPDGSQIAIAGDHNAVRLCDAHTGSTSFTLTGNSRAVACLAFSPDGTRVATASDDGIARIWDASTGEPLHKLAGHIRGIPAIAFAADGAYVVTASRDCTSGVWDAVSGERLSTLSGHTDSVVGIACSPDGSRVASASRDGSARIWNIHSAESLVTLVGQKDWGLGGAYSPDGTQIASSGDDGVARLIDLKSWETLHKFVGHTDHVRGVAFSSDGSRLATGSYDHTARIWDAATGTTLHTLIGHDAAIEGVAFSSDGKRLATASHDLTSRIWDVNTGESLHTLTGHKSHVVDVAFSEDGTRLATASTDETARIWDANTGDCLHHLQGHSSRVYDVAFSPDGRQIVTASHDNTARIWDAGTGKSLHTLFGHDSWVFGVGYSPDGSMIATASGDRTARLWEAATGNALSTLAGHTDRLFNVTFSPDGRRIATTSEDCTLRTWDTNSAECITTRYHFDIGSTATFSNSGELIWADGDAWRHLGVLATRPGGQLVRMPAEVLGPLPGIGLGPFADSA